MLSLIAERCRADGGRVEKADKLRSTRAAASAIQLSSEKALPRRFWLVARAQTIRSKKSPNGFKSVLSRSAKRLISSKRWRREVLFDNNLAIKIAHGLDQMVAPQH